MARTFETPKGTRDFLPEDMRLRTAVFERLVHHFRLFGYDELDTPTFEYLEVLTLKAGPAAEREIYSFDDKGGRRLGLRFDLTSSTGRFAAAHPELKRPIYRYQIGKVWRYDRPAFGRYREFYQADVDILGSYSMDCEVDLLLLATSVLTDFGLSDYRLVINNRKILEAQLRRSGVSECKADALRALDKVDKIGLDAVRKEAAGYGVPAEPFERFLALLGLSEGLAGRAYLERLREQLAGDAGGEAGVDELLHVLDAAEGLGFCGRLHVDPTLARGLDYYTGPIFEAKATISGNLLSFAAGGRYDDLIGLYGGQAQGAVGFSFGVERLIALMQEQGQTRLSVARPVLVGPVGPGRGRDAARVAMTLREKGVRVRLSVHATAPGKHLQYAEATGLRHVVLVGEKEVAEDRYPLRDLKERGEERLSLDEIAARLG